MIVVSFSIVILHQSALLVMAVVLCIYVDLICVYVGSLDMYYIEVKGTELQKLMLSALILLSS